MSYWWTHLVAEIADWFPGGLYGLGLGVLVLAILIGLLLQPMKLYRFSWKRKKIAKVKEAVIVADPVAEEALPDLPVDALLARAQHYMATGDYRLAVREWLRVMVRDLVDRRVVDNSPGWTVTELAASAGLSLPAAAGALNEAAGIFSDIWYGEREANLERAGRMRDLHGEVAQVSSAHQPVDIATAEAGR